MGKEVAAFGVEQLAIRRMLSGETVVCDAGEAVAEVGRDLGAGQGRQRKDAPDATCHVCFPGVVGW